MMKFGNSILNRITTSRGPKKLVLIKETAPSVFPEYPQYLQPPTEKKDRRCIFREVPNSTKVHLQNKIQIVKNDTPSTSLYC